MEIYHGSQKHDGESDNVIMNEFSQGVRME
jgi:hypothetical protein